MKGLFIILLLLLLTGCMNTEAKHSAEGPQQEIKKESRASNSDSANVITMEGKVIQETIQSIEPYRIQIPKLKVDAKIEKVGLLENGQMGVPTSFENVGWYQYGPKPGERGNAVLDGHVDSKTGPAVFYHLKSLKRGDEVIIYDQGGKNLTFVVTTVKSYPTNLSPVNEIFDYSYQSHLNLITCTGVFNRGIGSHEKRLVVYTILKE